MVKDAVVTLTSGRLADGLDFAAHFAISLGRAFGAHITGIAFVYEPVIPTDVIGGISGGIPSDIDNQREENSTSAKATADRFAEAARLAGVSFETRLADASVAGAPDLFGRIARRFDLAIVGQARREQGASEEMLIEGALFGSGRPVIIVPVIQSRGLSLERVVLCWDGSRPAARAIADAMPFLTRAKAVDIVVVTGERDRSGEITGKHMRQHLARHGIETEIKHIRAAGADAQNAIQSYVAEIGADFMVMGGYHHSRLREFILGGVTRGILKSMTVPVFMSR
jgi:nucleotide-binding universal stress UspA family protein